MRLLALLGLAACGSSPPPPAPLASHEEVAPRDTPPPSIAWAGSDFSATALPAIARAGEVAVVAVHETDGGRGYPNLRIEVRDRSDKVIQTIPVMTSNEFETLVADAKPTATLQTRLDTANRELARLHGLHDLLPMHPLEVQPPGEGEKHLAIGDGLDVDFNGDHLHVFHHNTDHSIVLRDTKGWLSPDHKLCASCAEMCTNPAFLAAVYKAADVNALIVDIGYKGTDTCLEPSDQLHVITW